MEQFVDEICVGYEKEKYANYKEVFKIIGFNKDRYNTSDEGKKFVEEMKQIASLQDSLKFLFNYNLRKINLMYSQGVVNETAEDSITLPFFEINYADKKKIIAILKFFNDGGKIFYDIVQFNKYKTIVDGKKIFFYNPSILTAEDLHTARIYINQSIAAKEDIEKNKALDGLNMLFFYVAKYKQFFLGSETQKLYENSDIVVFTEKDGGNFYFDIKKNNIETPSSL